MRDHGHLSELLQGSGVVLVGRPIEDDSKHRELALAQGLQAQQGVIEGAQSASCHEHDRAAPSLQLVELQPPTCQGNHQATGGFHHEGTVHLGQCECLGVQDHAVTFGGPVG